MKKEVQISAFISWCLHLDILNNIDYNAFYIKPPSFTSELKYWNITIEGLRDDKVWRKKGSAYDPKLKLISVEVVSWFGLAWLLLKQAQLF